jgi:ketosteroid isomerase-like protein
LARNQFDFAAVKTHWHPVDQASWLAPGDGINLQGWAAIEEILKTYFENNPEPEIDKFNHYDHVIHVEGDRAFVQYKEDVVWPAKVNGEQFTVKYYEVRRMIKVDGQWKIINMISSFLNEEKRPADVLGHLQSAAIALNAQDRPKEAAQVGTLLNKFFPDHPMGYVVLGRIAMKQKNKAKALKYFKKAGTLLDFESSWINGFIEAAEKME